MAFSDDSSITLLALVILALNALIFGIVIDLCEMLHLLLFPFLSQSMRMEQLIMGKTS